MAGGIRARARARVELRSHKAVLSSFGRIGGDIIVYDTGGTDVGVEPPDCPGRRRDRCRAAVARNESVFIRRP